MITEEYPLQWPMHVPRSRNRIASQFAQTLTKAKDNLRYEIEMLGGREIILTSDVGPRNKDGTLSLRAKRNPDDTGVAVYFTRKKIRQCISCDKYLQLWENIHALAKTIEALRGIERWGSSQMLDQAFTGFAALPAPTVVEPWYSVLEIDRNATQEEVQKRYLGKMYVAHPDRGGKPGEAERLNNALASFKAERGI